MNDTHRNSLIIIILWGLIISKCLALEYLVQFYSVPINSFVYVWLLTFGMATIATIVSFRSKVIGIQFSIERISIVTICWFGCTLVSLALICLFSISNLLGLNKLLTALSIILGFGYLFHGITTNQKIHTVSGISWWIGSAIILTRSDLESFRTGAILIILLSILPIIIDMRRKKIGFV